MTGTRTLPIRLATPDDATLMAYMSRDLVEFGLPWRYTPRAILRLLRSPTHHLAAFEEDGRLLGFGVMEFKSEEAHLVLLAVAPESQRRGLGRQIVTWLEQIAVTAGIEICFVEARERNLAARALYAALGYRELALVHGFYRGRENGVRMGKDLSAR